MRIYLLLCAVVASTQATTDSSDGLPNTMVEFQDQYNKVIVGPLDPEFYGLDNQDDVDEDDEPLGDIEEEIEEILDELDEGDVVVEVEEEVEEDEEEEAGQNNRKQGRGNRNKKLWKKFGRASSRRVSRFMRRRNVSDIEDVPVRRFKGPGLTRIHRRTRNEQGRAGVKQPIKRLYKKVTRTVTRKTQRETNAKMGQVCTKLTNRSTPRKGLLAKVPDALKTELIEMFNSRRSQLAQCCEMTGEDRPLCFAEAFVDKMEQVCRISERQQQLGGNRRLKFKNWQRKVACCEVMDDELRAECFVEVGAALKAEKKTQKQKKQNPQARMAAVCKNVDSPVRGAWLEKLFSETDAQQADIWKAIFQQRKNDLKRCCEMRAVRAKLNCVEDLKEARFERVCAGEEDFKPEPRYNAQKHGQLVQTCCEIEGAGRYQCFNTKGRTARPAAVRTPARPKLTVYDQGGADLSAVPVVTPIRQVGDIVVKVEMMEEVLDEEEEEMEEIEEEIEEMEMEDRMMGDAPARRRDNAKRQGKGKRNPQLRRVKRDCCIAGKETGQTFPNDGKAIAVRQEQCATNAEQHVESMEKLPGMCKKIYTRCCVKTGRQPCTDDNEEGCVRRNRGGRRQKHKNRRMNVEVNGDVEDIDELVKEVEIAIEEVADQM